MKIRQILPRQIMSTRQILSLIAVKLILGMGSLGSAIERPQVLPEGTFRGRLINATTFGIKDKFNFDGKIEGVTHSLNRNVSTADLAASSAQLTQMVNVLNTISSDLGNQLLGAELKSDFKAQLTQTVPVLGYGVNSRFSVGIVVPIIKRKITTSFQAKGFNNAAQIRDQLGNLSPALTQGLAAISNMKIDTAFFENALFTSKGYTSPHSFQKTELGDIELAAVYNFYKSKEKGQMATSFLFLRTPTGSVGDITNIYDTGSGQGNWSLTFKFIEEWKLNKYWKISSSQELELHKSDVRQRAVPKNAEDILPSLLKEDGQVQDVKRQRKPRFFGELAMHHLPNKAVSFWGAVQYHTENPSRFTGPGDLYYEGLEAATGDKSLNSELGVRYTSVPAFLEKKMSVPFEVSLLYNKTLQGMNQNAVEYVLLDLSVYYK